VKAPRVLVIGLDSMPPRLAFELLADELQNLSGLRRRGLSGPLRSTDPPITIPAWLTMTTGRSPAQLGIYGFRNAVPGGSGLRLTDARDVRFPRVWELLAGRDRGSAVVSVPVTWPPSAPGPVALTSCFLAPGGGAPWASSPELQRELEERHGPYLVDVEGFRSEDKGPVLEQARRITSQHFAILRHLIATRGPEFAMIVDIGPDRVHHALLSAVDPAHPRFDGGHPLAAAVRDYYRLLDRELGLTLELAGPGTLILVVSDHGVRPLLGAVCVNEWLLDAGFLALGSRPAGVTPFQRLDVDWGNTTAFAEGGYHARVWLNLAGRQPRGTVAPERAEALLEELARGLAAIPGPDGRPMDNRVLRAAELYGTRPAGLPPDLTVYFDGLGRRAAGTVGHGTIHLPGNDTGPDDANHDFHGILVAAGPGIPAGAAVEGLEIADVFATCLAALGLDPPPGTGGRPVGDAAVDRTKS
jgi:predicted AlkP superfamily phosphohydrolase/phosphomutase